MKMTSKSIFSFVAAGLLLSSVTSQALAQTSPSPKPMSKKALKTLCKKTPTDSRCPASTKAPGASSLKDSSSTPASTSGSDPMKPAGDTMSPPASTGGSDPMKPAGDTMSPPASTGGSDPMKPAGDTMSPPAAGGTPVSPSGGTSKP
jgi:hypothetical protein